LYRKLYMEALVYFILFAVIGMIPMVSLLMWVASGGILPYFVYKRYKKTLTQVEENIGSTDEQFSALQTVGGVNEWAIWVAVAFHAVMWIGVIYMTILVSAV